MTSQEFLESKKEDKKVDRLKRELLAIHEGILPDPISKYFNNHGLSKKDAEVGLFLLRAHPSLIKKDTGPQYFPSGYETFSQAEEWTHQLWKIIHPSHDWKPYRALFDFLFGSKNTPLVLRALDLFPKLPYQESWTRRSFRAPNAPQLYFTNQLNFLYQLTHCLVYNFDLATYAVYSNDIYQSHVLCYVWASAIEDGDKKLKELFFDIVLLRHEHGRVSQPIVKAMMIANRPEAWEAVGKLLLSAQRQEGLRQTILESVDEAHKGALEYLMGLILEHKLTRFSSVVRALDVWAGLAWENEKESTVRRFLEIGHRMLQDKNQIPQAIKSKGNAEVYMALWTQAVEDVWLTPPFLREVVSQGTIGKICLALHFAYQTQLTNVWGEFGISLISHPHLAVFTSALDLLNSPTVVEHLSVHEQESIYKIVEQRIEEIPKKGKHLATQTFDWLTVHCRREEVFSLLIKLTNFEIEESVQRLLVHWNDIPVNERTEITRKVLRGYLLSYHEHQNEAPVFINKWRRNFAFQAISDRTEMIRSAGFRALKNTNLKEAEIPEVLLLLKRKTADVRLGVMTLIIDQKPAMVKQSIDALLTSGHQDQRLAGLDLLVQCKKAHILTADWISSKANDFSSRAKIPPKEETLLEALLIHSPSLVAYTPENGFGLYDPDSLSTWEQVKAPSNTFYNEKTASNHYGLSQSDQRIQSHLEELHRLFLSHQKYEYDVERWDGSVASVLLGNEFTCIKRDYKDMSPDEKYHNFPLGEIWKNWWDQTGLTAFDLFLLNLSSYRGGHRYYYMGRNNQVESKDYANPHVFVPEFPILQRKDNFYHQNPFSQICLNLRWIYPCETSQIVDFLQGLTQKIFSSIPDNELNKFLQTGTQSMSGQPYGTTWRNRPLIGGVYSYYSSFVEEMSNEQFQYFWMLDKFHYDTLPEELLHQFQQPIYNVVRAYSQRLIPKDELIARIMQPDAISFFSSKGQRVQSEKMLQEFDFLVSIFDECKERVLEVELKRGDSNTAVSYLAEKLNSFFGLSYFVSILQGLGKDTLHRGYYYGFGSVYPRKVMFSHLLSHCFPAPSTIQEEFNQAIRESDISEKRLVEAALYAPQWLDLIDGYLGWNGFKEAAWWLKAHTNGFNLQTHESIISSFSKVPIGDFARGAVDMVWFHQAYKALGKSRWKLLYQSAKYITDGSGHKRATLYADVMLGTTKITEVKARVKDKRNQDYLRVFGLVPLSKKVPEKDVLNRYTYIQAFLKESKQFGSQRQESEKAAAAVALENLARTAGFPDPIRLTWAMEKEVSRKILQETPVIDSGDLTARLGIGSDGKASILISRGGKLLASPPSAIRKHKDYKLLKQNQKVLREQFRRTRSSLEKAMVNGDLFSKKEVQELMDHPVVSPLLRKLVWASGEYVGFWKEGQLVSPTEDSFETSEWLKLAHCSDLHDSHQWPLYQKYCFEHQIRQPFKQIFRELYLPTADEIAEKTISRRYAGHQIQPQKTIALLKTRGWTTNDGQGLQKVYHDQNLIARIFAMADWFTPADIEAPTLETIRFFERFTGKAVEFEKVPARIFSEVMRDVDLVVSVAHVGEVDPEASQSTIQMRAVIMEETARLFQLNNVKIQGNHAHINGKYGQYSVHLGSAVTHQVPGISLSIVPVHSQKRGRIFLPFLDEDPRSAEIMSKVLLLAKDENIQDPTILQQIQR